MAVWLAQACCLADLLETEDGPISARQLRAIADTLAEIWARKYGKQELLDAGIEVNELWEQIMNTQATRCP